MLLDVTHKGSLDLILGGKERVRVDRIGDPLCVYGYVCRIVFSWLPFLTPKYTHTLSFTHTLTLAHSHTHLTHAKNSHTKHTHGTHTHKAHTNTGHTHTQDTHTHTGTQSNCGPNFCGAVLRECVEAHCHSL